MHRYVRKAVMIGRRLLYLLMAVYLVVVLLAMSFEDSLIYCPARFPKGNWHPAELTAEDAWFQSADGTRLHGWYVPCEKPVAVVLLCPGQGGNISYRLDRLRLLHNRVHVTLLAFDYRGYGRSEGVPNEKGILADARAARAWLARRAGIAEQDVVLLGESLGGGVAVDLAASDGARALVLENTFARGATPVCGPKC